MAEESKVTVVEETISNESPNKDEPGPSLEFLAVIDYLGSENGNALANRLMGFLEEKFKTSIEKSTRFAIHEHWSKVVLVSVIVITSAVLSIMGKFSSELGILLGTVIGLTFSKKANGG